MDSSLTFGDTDDIGNAGSIGGVVSIEELPIVHQEPTLTSASRSHGILTL